MQNTTTPPIPTQVKRPLTHWELKQAKTKTWDQLQEEEAADKWMDVQCNGQHSHCAAALLASVAQASRDAGSVAMETPPMVYLESLFGGTHVVGACMHIVNPHAQASGINKRQIRFPGAHLPPRRRPPHQPQHPSPWSCQPR